MYNIGPYPEEIVTDHLYFQWPDITKMKRMYQKLLKEGNVNHNHLRCTDLQDNNFEVLSSSITLDEVDLVFAETVKTKPTGYYSGFITY